MLRRALTLSVAGPLAIALALVLGACSSDEAPRPVQPEFDLHHPDCRRRSLAADHVAQRREARWIPDLIELLDDEDETVRLQAITGLREITGHETGYAPFLTRAERLEHMALWHAWWGQHQHAGASSGGPIANEPASGAGR